MKFDEIVSVLGEFGPYQKRIYFLICLPSITVYIQMVINIFTMAVPAHRCAVPGLDNDTYAIQDSHHAAIVNTSISPHDSCHVIIDVVNGTVLKNSTLAEGPFRSAFSPSGVSNSEMVRGSGENVSLMEGHLAENSEAKTQEATCSRYVYDTSVFSKTIVTQMNLVCEQKTKVTHAKMALFAGATFAAVGCVPPSDVFGRKRMLMVSFFFHAVASLAITWSTYYIPLCVFMFLNGMASVGVFAHSFVIGMELVGPSKRVWAGFVIEVCFALGLVLLAPMAYLLRDWQHLQIASAIVPFGYLSYYWLIPESPRWLLSKGRVLEAEAIIRTAAKVNKVTLPARVLDEQSLRVETQESVANICHYPVLVFRSVVIFYNWFAVTLGYYGLALNIGSLSGNIFLNVFISGVLELVSYLLCLCLLDRLGRRWLNSGLMLLGGIACTLTIFTALYAPKSLQWTTTALAMLGRMGIAAAYATIYVYSSELFPTVIRSSGMGASSFCGRIGSVIAPYITGLSTVIGGDEGTAVPLLVFGLSSILGGCLLLTLPETRRRRLPETLDDAINFTRRGGGDKDQDLYLSVQQDDPAAELTSPV